MPLKVNVSTAESRRESEKLRKSLKELGSSAIENEKDFEKLQKRMEKGLNAKVAKRAIDELQDSIKLTRLETAKLQRETGDYTGALRTLTPVLKMSSSSMVAMGAAMGAIGLAAGKSLSEFGLLDEGLIGVQKTTNATDAEMVALKNSILDMAATLPVPTEKLLEIAQAAGQLGVKGVENITLFTDTIARLEMTTDIAGEEAAKSLARILNVSGESIDKIDELGSAIVALGNNMEASESEIVSMASEISRSVAAFKVSSEASIAYGVALKSMGAQAELSGSAIGRSMVEIESAIINGGEAFEYLQRVTGMTGDQLEKTFQRDASQVFNAWIRGMGRMVDSGESAISLLADFGMTGVEQIKALTPLISNVEKLDQAFEIANREIKSNSALMEESLKASESFRSQMAMTMNVIDEVAASIGSGLAPTIVQITQEFREWADENKEFIREDLPQYLKNISDAAGFVSSSLSGVAKNVAINSQAFALAKEGQISWLDFIRASTDELAEMVQEFGNLAKNVPTMEYREWQDQYDGLIEKQERLNDQIKMGQFIGILTEEGLKNLEKQRDELTKQIEEHKKLVKVAKESSSAVTEEAEESIKVLSKQSGLIEKDKDAILKARREILKAQREQVEKEKEQAREKEKIIKDFYRDYEKVISENFDYQIQKLDEDYDNFDKHIKDKLTLEEWYSYQLGKILDRRNEKVDKALDNFFGDIDSLEDDYYDDIIKKQKDSDEAIKKSQDDMFNSNREHLYNMMDDWDNAGDYLVGVAKNTAKEMGAAFLTQQITMPIATNVLGNFGVDTPSSITEMAGGQGVGSFDILSGASTLYNAFTGGISSTVGNVLTSEIGTAIGTSLFGGAYLGTGAGLAAGSAGTMAGVGGTAVATGGAAAGSIAATLTTIAPYLAALAIAVPILSDVFGHETTPPSLGIGAIGSPQTNLNLGQIVGSDIFPYVTDIGGVGTQEAKDALTGVLTGYFDTIFTAFNEQLGISSEEILSGQDFDVEVIAKDRTEESITEAFNVLIENTFNTLRESLVSSVLPGMGEIFDESFFKNIAIEGEDAFTTFQRFGSVVQDSTDFIGQFTRQTEEFGESTQSAYENIALITSILTEVETGVSNITDVSSIAAINTLTDDWNALIESLKTAHAVTEDVTATQSAMAQVLGANITGLTGNALQSAFMSGGDIDTIIQSAIQSAGYAEIAQRIADGYVAGINQEIGQVWIDTGGDIQAVVEAMQAIDTSEAQAEIIELQNVFGLFVDDADEASRIITLAIEGQLTAAQQFAEWQIENADALSLYSEMTQDSVTRNELEGAVEAFINLGLRGDELNIVIQDLADRFVSATDDLTQSISDIESAQAGLIGVTEPDTDFISDLTSAQRFFQDIPSWDEIIGTISVPVDTVVPLTREDYEGVVEGLYGELFGRSADVSGLEYWTNALMDATDDIDWNNIMQHMVNAATGADLEYLTTYDPDIRAITPLEPTTVTTYEDIPKEIDPILEGKIQQAISILDDLPNIIVDGIVNEANLQEWISTIGGMESDVLNQIFGADAVTMINNLTNASNDYYDSLTDSVNSAGDAVSDLVDTIDITSEKRRLEVAILEAQGDTEGALALDREGILDGLTERYSDQASVLVDLQEKLWGLEDAAADAATATEINNTKRQLEIQILEAQGDTEGALAMKREDIINDLTEKYGDQASTIIDLQEELWGLEDAATAAAIVTQAAADAENELTDAESARNSAAAAYRSGLQDELNILENNLADAKSNYLDILNDELSIQEDLARSMRDAVKSMREYRESIWTKEDSPYGEAVRKDILLDQISKLYTLSMGGDTEAMSDLLNMTDQYLDLTRDTSTTWADYQRESIRMATILADVEAYAGEQAIVADDQIIILKDLIDEVEGLDDTITDRDAARTAWETAQSDLDNNWYEAEIDKLDEILQENKTLTELFRDFDAAQINYVDIGGVRTDPGFAGFDPVEETVVGVSPPLEHAGFDPVEDLVFGSTEGFATGGSFKVSGQKGKDILSLPNLRVTDGEMVNISRPDVMSELLKEIVKTREKMEELTKINEDTRNSSKITADAMDKNDIVGWKTRAS